MNVIELKALESVINSNHVLNHFRKVIPRIADYQSQLLVWDEDVLLSINAHHSVSFFIY